MASITVTFICIISNGLLDVSFYFEMQRDHKEILGRENKNQHSNSLSVEIKASEDKEI